MKVKIITALYDIDRENKGDGRKMSDYLTWFKETLKLKCDMSIYIEEKFKSFVEENSKSDYKREIIIQQFSETPFYKNNEKIKKIISSNSYKSKMKDVNRIECYLSEYSIIQYSKFGWITNEIEKDDSYDLYFWMDAGFSRFFYDFDLNSVWPGQKNIPADKITIQGNYNYISMFPTLNINDYMWDNNCLLSGGLFGGGKEVMKKLHSEVNNVVNLFFMNNCFNNEQFAFAIINKKYINMFNVIIHFDGTPMPIFKILS